MVKTWREDGEIVERTWSLVASSVRDGREGRGLRPAGLASRTGDLGRPFVKMLAEARLLAEVFHGYVAICGKTVGGIT